MIAVICRKAKRKLGKIARADDQRVFHVRKIHEHLRAFARLRIFKGCVGETGRVADVLQMPLYGGADVDRAAGDAERVTQPLRIVLCAVRRAEAGHCDGEHVRRGTV